MTPRGRNASRDGSVLDESQLAGVVLWATLDRVGATFDKI